MSGITDLIQTITIGAANVVTVKRYGNGVISFTKTTALGPEVRTEGSRPEQGWMVKFLAALATVD